jgi:hypothetical protein
VKASLLSLTLLVATATFAEDAVDRTARLGQRDSQWASWMQLAVSGLTADEVAALLDEHERISGRVPAHEVPWSHRGVCARATRARTEDELVAVMQWSHDAQIAIRHGQGVDLLAVLEPSRRAQFLEFLREHESSSEIIDPDYREVVRRGGFENVRKRMCPPPD